MTEAVHRTTGPGVWGDPTFVDRWMSGDVGMEALATPRAITAALIHDSGLLVRKVVDVGSGPGSFLRVLLEAFPSASGTWIDASEAMLERATADLADLAPRVRFEVGDIRQGDRLPLEGDVIVSARAVHHFRPETIQAFYRAAHASLSPAGFLCNLDHFGTPWREAYKRIKPGFVPRSGGGTGSHDHDAPPQPLGDHLAWLRDAGFVDPDVPWRLFWTALVVGRTRGPHTS
jgi:SAM-dependent methyltransferase